MFIEFDTPSGAILLNVRQIVLMKRSSSGTEIILANGGSTTPRSLLHASMQAFASVWCG